MNDVSGGSCLWPFFVLSFPKTLWRSQTAFSSLLWKRRFRYIRNASYCILFIYFWNCDLSERKCPTFSHVLQFVSEQSFIWHYCACLKRSRSVVVTCHGEVMQGKCFTASRFKHIWYCLKGVHKMQGHLPVELPADLDLFDSYFKRSETDRMDVLLETKSKRLTFKCFAFWEVRNVFFQVTSMAKKKTKKTRA